MKIINACKNKLVLFAVGALACLAVAAAFPAGSANALPELVFVSDRDGSNVLYGIAADGSALVQLTQNGLVSDSPRWSPDGMSLAFISASDGNANLYVMDAAGSVQLTHTPNQEVQPAWSPDGEQIAFAVSSGEQQDIFIIRRDGSEPRALTTDGQGNTSPAWSPDGKQIAFISGKDLCTVAAAGGNKTCQPADYWHEEASSPAWTPDGAQILYLDRDNAILSYFDRVAVVNADLSNLRILSPAFDVFASSPTLLPDGQHVLYITDALHTLFSERLEIYLNSLAGGEEIRLTRNHRNEDSITLSPDGAQMAYTASAWPWKRTSIYVADIDGSHARRIFSTRGQIDGLAWRP
jgi:TolB protein